MKLYVIISIFFLLFAQASIAVPGVMRLQSTNGICVEVILDHGDSLSSDKDIYYGFLQTTNARPVAILCPTKEYLCRLRLVDEAGNAVPPTKAWQSFGGSFSELGEYSVAVVEKVPANGSNAEHPRLRYLHVDYYAGDKLPSPDTLFQISSPGTYSLRMEFQVYKREMTGTNISHKLVRLPPLDVPVKRK